MKILSILTIALFVAQTSSINYIGLAKPEIIKVMQKSNPGFDLDEGVVNNTYNYLKFVDKYNEETWLFFLSTDNVCTHTKLISDYSNLNLRVGELNKQFKNAGENKWVTVEKSTVYTIELKREEWFFSIVIKPKK